MKFTFKQVFSIIDGRLSTELGDVYEMLNIITGESLMTHHLPVAMKFIKKVNPDWFARENERLDEIKGIVGDDFKNLMEYIDKMEPNRYVEIGELTKKQKEGFGEFMVKNSLFNNI